MTILELLLSLALLSVVAVKAQSAWNSMAEAESNIASQAVLEDQARRVLRQIGYAVMGANRETLIPDAEVPMSMEDLRFQVNLGISDGEVIWSDPEEVALEETSQEIVWSQNPDTSDERRVVWTRLVSPFLEGELPNGMDDNGNGLIDEKGLSFVIDGNAVTIRLTLERLNEEGESVQTTVQTTVTCRNLGDTSL